MPSPLSSVLPAPDEKSRTVRSMFDRIAPRYELVNRLMTFGLDARWRTRTIRSLGLPTHSLVLDVACGTGDLSRTCVAQQLRPVGVDLSFGMLAAAHDSGPLVHADATQLPVATASVDGVVCGYGLRNFADLPAALHEMARVVRPGGRLGLLEVAEPTSPALRLGHQLWFTHAVPLIGGVLSDRDAYRYLPASTVYLPSRDELRSLLIDAGFSGVNHRLASGGLSQILSATRSADA